MIFIKGNVASSKNAKRWTGKMLINSKTVMNYKKSTQEEWKSNKERFLSLLKDKDKPYRIEFFFIRDSKRRFDYINAAQLPLDLMQDYQWLEDDSMEYVIPVFKGFKVDKENTGVEINVL